MSDEFETRDGLIEKAIHNALRRRLGVVRRMNVRLLMLVIPDLDYDSQVRAAKTIKNLESQGGGDA